MWAYVVKRVIRALGVVLLGTFLALALLRLTPGSVANALLGDQATPESVAKLEHSLGLDEAITTQYTTWLSGMVRGDLGNSLYSGQEISTLIAQRLPVTLELALVALTLALGVAIPTAVVAASRPRGFIDRFSTGCASAAISIPAFVAGPVLVYFFSVKGGLLPATGWIPLTESPLGNLQSVLLPALAIALPEAAAFQRLLRTDLASTIREDYIEAARSRGLGRRYIMWRHALRPSSFSILTLAGITFGRLLGGAIVVETLFALPGLGQLMVQSINARDVLTVQGVVAFVVIAYVAINTVVDVCYGILDPRVRIAVRR